jgi:hypothetical protein
MFKKLLFFSALFFMAGCQTELTKDFSFLEGSWKMETSDSTYLLETWEKVNDTKYTALNYFITDTGMQLTEEIEIDITDSGTFYRPTIEAIDGGRQFSYLFISEDDNKYVFENKEYDFPRRIWYKRVDENNIEAAIENASGDKKEVFRYEKVMKP